MSRRNSRIIPNKIPSVNHSRQTENQSVIQSSNNSATQSDGYRRTMFTSYIQLMEFIRTSNSVFYYIKFNDIVSNLKCSILGKWCRIDSYPPHFFLSGSTFKTRHSKRSLTSSSLKHVILWRTTRGKITEEVSNLLACESSSSAWTCRVWIFRFNRGERYS